MSTGIAADRGFDFGAALAFMRRGIRVQRAGWNGKGMWLALLEPGDWQIESDRVTEGLHLGPCVVMRTADAAGPVARVADRHARDRLVRARRGAVPVMRALLALLALVALAGCDPPSQADPARYGEVSVYVAPEWLPSDHQRIRDELVLLGALGPRFAEAGEGNRSTARVIVQPYDSQGCTLGAGRWIVGSRVVEIDADCTPGDTAFRQAVGHEIGHALGMQHVCAHEGDAPDCSPVGYGPAMMAPRLGGERSIGFGEAFAGDLGEDAPTELDLAEYRRVHPDGGAP